MVVAVSQQRREEGGEGCDSGRVRVAWLRHGGAERKKEKGAILGGEGGAVAMWQRRKEGGKWCNTGRVRVARSMQVWMSTCHCIKEQISNLDKFFSHNQLKIEYLVLFDCDRIVLHIFHTTKLHMTILIS